MPIAQFLGGTSCQGTYGFVNRSRVGEWMLLVATKEAKPLFIDLFFLVFSCFGGSFVDNMQFDCEDDVRSCDWSDRWHFIRERER